MNKRLSKELKNLDGKRTVLVVSSAGVLQENVIDIVEFLVKEEKIPGLYVSLNKPYKIVKDILNNKEVEDKLSFVDTISYQEKKIKKVKDVLLIQNPADLITISIAIGAFSEQIKTKKFLIIDALSTLLIYNSLETIAKFIQSLSFLSKRGGNFLMIFATSGSKDNNLFEKITPLFDKIVEMN